MSIVTKTIEKVKGMSAIEWTHYTGGPWMVCTEVSPGCARCYARELMESRLGHQIREAYQKAGFKDWKTRPVWGKNAPRVKTKGFWKDAYACDREAAKKGVSYRMFPSLIDWLDDMPAGIIDQDGNQLEPIAVLADFLKVIHDTPNLDWLLLTKRPENCEGRVNDALKLIDVGTSMWTLGGLVPHNVWIGTSVENQAMADERIPELLKIPAKIRFLSVEPMLADIDLKLTKAMPLHDPEFGDQHEYYELNRGIHWLIFGGESGPESRPCNVDWIRRGVMQGQEAGAKVFVKQLGANVLWSGCSEPGRHWPATPKTEDVGGQFRVTLKHPKGGDMSEWPEDMRIREFPE